MQRIHISFLKLLLLIALFLTKSSIGQTTAPNSSSPTKAERKEATRLYNAVQRAYYLSFQNIINFEFDTKVKFIVSIGEAKSSKTSNRVNRIIKAGHLFIKNAIAPFNVAEKNATNGDVNEHLYLDKYAALALNQQLSGPKFILDGNLPQGNVTMLVSTTDAFGIESIIDSKLSSYIPPEVTNQLDFNINKELSKVQNDDDYYDNLAVELAKQYKYAMDIYRLYLAKLKNNFPNVAETGIPELPYLMTPSNGSYMQTWATRVGTNAPQFTDLPTAHAGSNLFDYAGSLTPSMRTEVITLLTQYANNNSNSVHIYITDVSTSQAIRTDIYTKAESAKASGISSIHVHFAQNGKAYCNYYLAGALQLKSENEAALKKAMASAWAQTKLFDEKYNVGLMCLKWINSFLLSTKIKDDYIFTKLYDAQGNVTGSNPNYDPFFANLVSLGGNDFWDNLKSKVLSISPNSAVGNMPTPPQFQVAMLSGLWNGLIDEIQSIPGLMISLHEGMNTFIESFIINTNNTRGELMQGLSVFAIQLTTPQGQVLLTQQVGKAVFEMIADAHNGDMLRVTHQIAKDVIFVITLFVGVGEIAALVKGTTTVAKIFSVPLKMFKAIRKVGVFTIKRGSGIVWAITNGTLRIAKTSADELVFAIKATADAAFHAINWNNIPSVSMQLPNGQTKSMKVLFGANGNETPFTNKILDIIKDETGKVVKDNNGDGIGKVLNNGVDDRVVIHNVEELLLNNAGSLATHVDIQASLSTIANLKSTNKLTKAIGNASDLELGAIHKYTEDGGVILTSMRNGNETVIDAVNFNTFQSQLYQSIKSGLTKLRQTNRLVTGTVTRGRTYKLADYNTLFNSGNVNVPLKGMVSCTKNESVAIDFLTKSGQNISGSKVKVIMKIKSKNGVDIDDFSDWGVNLVNQRHPGNLIQEEVLLDEGMFKMIGQPVLIKTENGIPWYEVNLEELGTPLRTIN